MLGIKFFIISFVSFLMGQFTKKFIVILFVATLAACTIGPNLAPLLPVNNYLLVETAIGKDLGEARAKALSLLTQDIVVEIKNNFSSKEVLDSKGVFSNNVTNIINVDSAGYFKDITFSKAENLGKKGYKISAGLSSKALLASIAYLQHNLKTPVIDSLSKQDLQEEHNKATFLIALILYAKSNNLALPKNNLKEILSYQKALILRLSNAAQIIFNISPNLNNSASINIINKTYKANKLIFLPEGTYYYTVFAKGYKTKTSHIDLQSNDKLTINLYLQKLLNQPIKVKLLVSANNLALLNNSLKKQIINLLPTYQLQASDFTANKLQINFLATNSTKLNNYYYFNLPLEISLIKNNKTVISKIFNIQYVNKEANSTASTSFIIQKLNAFLEEITAGNNLNKAYR